MDLQACGYGRSSIVRNGTSSQLVGEWFSSLIFILFQVKGVNVYIRKNMSKLFREKLLPRKFQKRMQTKMGLKSQTLDDSKVVPGDPRSGGHGSPNGPQVADESKAKNGKTASKVMGLRVGGGSCWLVKNPWKVKTGKRSEILGKMGVTTLQPLNSQYINPRIMTRTIIIIFFENIV